MISDVIKEIRRKNYLNQTAFANRIGVTQGTVSQWECGLTRPNLDQLKSISAAFGVSIDEMLSEVRMIPHDSSPQTKEAKIVSIAMDKLPREDRQQILAVVRAMKPDAFDDELPLMG